MQRPFLLFCQALLAGLLVTSTTFGQPVTDSDGDVGIGTLAPDGSAVLDLDTKNRGFLMPRLATSERDQLILPATGLYIINITDTVPEYNCGTPTVPIWCRIATDSNMGDYAWRVLGNTGTNPAVNFLGTTDAQPLVVRTDNTERMRVLANGQVGIGTASPDANARLDVVGRVNSNASYDLDGDRFVWDGPTGGENTFVGRTENVTNTGEGNSFFGYHAGNNTAGGANNTFIGAGSGAANITGDSNTFVGRNAGRDNSSGLASTFVGVDAGRNNTVGVFNTFVGTRTGASNLDGFRNSFFGTDAGRANIDGAFNAFFGNNSGLSNTSGRANSFFGDGSGIFNTTGNRNTFLGQGAGVGNQTGEDNTFVGHFAGLNGSSHNFNTYLGAEAGRFGETSTNTYVGYHTGRNNVTGNANTLMGYRTAINSTGTANTFIGWQAGLANTSGNEHSSLGFSAGPSTGALTNTTAIGAYAQAAQSNSVVLGSINGVNGATADVNVGIGTTSPDSKLEVENGDVYVDNAAGLNGVILRSGTGTCYRITVADPGVLVVTAIPCP